MKKKELNKAIKVEIQNTCSSFFESRHLQIHFPTISLKWTKRVLGLFV